MTSKNVSCASPTSALPSSVIVACTTRESVGHERRATWPRCSSTSITRETRLRLSCARSASMLMRR